MPSVTLDLTSLKRRLLKRAGEQDSVYPVLSLVLYSELSIQGVSKGGAAALSAFLRILPEGTLRSCALAAGGLGKLTPRRIARDLRHLENPPKSEDLISLQYLSGQLGPPSAYEVFLYFRDPDPDVSKGTQLLRFDFPWSLAEGAHVEDFVKTVTELASLFPYSVGNAGFGLNYHRQDGDAERQVLEILPRFAGFDHSDVYLRDRMRGRTPRGNWLTFVSKATEKRLRTPAAKAFEGTEVQLVPVGDGIMIRAARFPPVGDVNRLGADIGALPLVAKWLKPLRFKQGAGFGTASDDFDADAWIAALDDLKPGPWENR